MNEASRDGTTMRGAVDVSEGFFELGGGLWEILVPDPVVEALARREIAIVGGNCVAVGKDGKPTLLFPSRSEIDTHLRR